MKFIKLLSTVVALLITIFCNAQWTQLTVPNSTASMNCAYFKNTNEGFVAGAEHIRHTLNGGATWDTVSYGIYWAYLGGCIVENIHFVSATEGIASGWNFWDNCEIVFKTYDGGNTWTDIKWGNANAAFGTYLHDMTFVNSSSGICVGDLGHIITTNDAGDNWNYIASGTTNNLYGVHFIGNSGWVVGDEIILSTTNMGSNWSSQSFPNEYFKDVYFTSANVGYAVGNHIYKTIDGGTTWNQVPTSYSLDCNDVWAANADTIYIANSGNILKSNDAGATWFPQQTAPVGKIYEGVWFLNPTFGLATAYDGTVYKTTTGGDPVQQNDAGVDNIAQQPANSCQGSYPIQLQIKNFGQVNLTQAKIEWTVNGIAQVPYIWNGNLDFDSTSTLFTIGNYTFGGGQFPVQAYTTQANNVSDYIHDNDTASTQFSFLRLNGTYTIGGAAPDYATVADAVNALNSYGTCGNVEFKIRNGAYSAALTINNYYRTNLTDSVSFTSESGDSTQVIITAPTPISFNSTKNVSFNNLTLLATSSNTCTLLDSSNQIAISHCVLQMTGTTGTAVFHNGYGCEDFSISNCVIKNGNAGISLAPSGSGSFDNMDGIRIINCIFENLNSFGISITNGKDIIVSGNSVTSVGSPLALVSCNSGFLIEGNKFISSASNGLMNFSSCLNSLGSEGIVANNYMAYTSIAGVISKAIMLHTCSYINMYYNTINTRSTASIYIYNQDTSYNQNYIFKNNVVNNIAPSLVFDLTVPTGSSSYYYTKIFKDISNNAYCNPSTPIAGYEYRFAFMGNFESWKGYYPSDSNSVFAKPQYANLTDPHLYPNTENILFNNKATPIAGITSDIDGNLRSVTTPDIGCDEFNLFTADAGVKSFNHGARICAGISDVQLRIGNFGSNAINNATVNWTVDGIAQTAFTYTGNVTSGDSSSIIAIGSFNFTAANSYTIQAWTSNPNGTTDLNNVNDTISLTVVAGGLGGVYTIGGVTPDFANFTAAAAALNAQGICSPVTFNVRAGIYNEFITLNNIIGSSAYNSITFQSENGDSASVFLYSTSNKVILLNGASYITFSKISIVDSTGSSANACVYFQNTPHHITVENCVLSQSYYILQGDINGINDITVRNNKISALSTVMSFQASTLYSKRITITGNVIDTMSLYAFDFTKVSNIIIDNNSITGSIGSQTANSGIRLNTPRDGVQISNNKINLTNFGNAIIIANQLGQPYNQNKIVNNMISMKGQYGGLAIWFSTSDNVTVAYNSIAIDTTCTSGTGISISGTGHNIFNNSIACFNPGGYALYNSIFTGNNYDYNNYYAVSGNPFYYLNLDYDLAGWKNFTNQDANSVSADPAYLNIDDLHLGLSYDLNNAGTPLTGIDTDIDGDTRNATTPDIGADEFNLVLQANDAGIWEVQQPGLLCDGSNPVFVKIKNYGSSNLTSAKIDWTVNGVAQTQYSWAGNLASLTTSGYVQVGTYNFSPSDSVGIAAWTTLPNNATDLVSINDSASTKNIRTRLSGAYTFGGVNPDYNDFDILLSDLKTYGICGPVTVSFRDGVYDSPYQEIPAITGTSATNTIAFQSESGDSTLVTINNGSFSNPTLNLNNADYFTFKQLTVTGSSSDYPFHFDKGTSYCNILNCRVTGGPIMVNDSCNHILIENNYVNSQIYMTSSSPVPGIGNTIRGNILVSDVGIVCQYEDSLLIEKNNIINPSPFVAGGNSGIDLLSNYSGGHFRCVKNRISGNFSTGINLTQHGTVSDTGIVANNIISGGSAGGGGISISTTYVKVVYNTFYTSATSGGYPCQNLSGNNALGMVIKNNHFVHAGTNWAYYWGQIGGESDYNNYFTNGPVLINLLVTTDYPDLPAFQSAHPGYDANSTNVDPQFPNSSFLYPSNPAAQGTGTPIYGVYDDINDSLRSTTNPNMGAMEVPPVVIHDSINKDIVVKLLNDTVVIGNNTISVQVSNERPFTTDSALHIYEGVIDTLYLSYSVNGSAPVNETWTGSLALYDSITFNFAQQYNVPNGKLYHVHIEVQLPNKFTVIDYTNDTLTKDIGSPMTGTYTVNGTNPDFENLDAAVASLYAVGTSGDVVFNSRAGLDSIYSINNYYDPHFVTFQSESGNANDVQIIFSVAYNSYRINFKNVTIYPKTNTDYLYNYKGAEFTGGMFSIDSCIIQGTSDPLYRNGITFVYTDSLSVTNCHFVNLDNGITLSDYQSFGSNYFYGNNYIINNTFDTVTNCIHLLGQLAGDTTIVERNVMNHPDKGVDYDPSAYCVRYIMEKNKITEASTDAFSAGNGFTFTTGEFKMNNNMLGGRVQINNFFTDSINFNYNSILGFMEMQDCQNVHMHNNSIYSATTNRALFFLQSDPGATIYDCDNNNYYAPLATELAYVFINGLGGGTMNTIADITALTGAETNSISADPHYFNASDLHSNSPLLNNAGAPVAGITTDIDDELRSITTPDIGCDEFNVADSLVWPGDCNYDGTANNYDLLSIGLYFNQTGTTRAGASNAWVGQASANWGALQYCGYDKKHADCNGDGIISWSDTTAIKLNWGQSHPLKTLQIPFNSLLNDLHFVSSSTAYKPGDTVDVEIWAGDIANPVTSLYGISFDVAFPSNMVKAGSMTLTYNPSWIGVENVTAITTANIGVTAAGSIVRNTGTDTLGYGMFAKLHFIVEPTLTTVSDFILGFSNYLALTANGNLLQFNTVSDTLTIDPALSIEENASQRSFNLYPNPTTDETTISYVLQSSSQIKIELFNSIGEKIKVLKDEKQQAGNHHLKINFNNKFYPRGIYFVKMMVDGKVYAKKLVVE